MDIPKIKKKDYLKVAFLSITILLSLFVFGNRFISEQKNLDVELVFDYDDILQLRAHTGQSLDRIYRSLQKAGVSTICIPEDTLVGLSSRGKATWLKGEVILNRLRTGEIQLRALSSAKIVPGNYYIIIDRSAWYERAKNSLKNELGNHRVKEVGKYVLEIKGYTDNLGHIGLGINKDLIDSLRWYKFNVIPKKSFKKTKKATATPRVMKNIKINEISNLLTSFIFLTELTLKPLLSSLVLSFTI